MYAERFFTSEKAPSDVNAEQEKAEGKGEVG